MSIATRIDEAGPAPKRTKKAYPSYSTEDRARIRQYAAEHGPTKAPRHFPVPESTARLLKKQYFTELHDRLRNSATIPEVKHLPSKSRGRPLLLGSTLDDEVKESVTALRATAGVVNTAIVLAAA